jgi:hypothetical protein
VIWVRIEQEKYDPIGLVLGALALVGTGALVTLALGTLAGLAFIARRRRERDPNLALHLGEPV